MVIEMWESTAKQGKTSEAVAFFNEWAAQMNKKQASTKARVLRPEQGDLYKILLIQEFDSLAARDQFFESFGAENDLKKWMTKLESCLDGLENRYYKTSGSY